MAYKDPERARQAQRRWCREHPDRVKAAHDRYVAKHPERHRSRHRKYRYGLTHEQFLSMRACQNNACAICGTPAQDARGGRLVVDHDHETGRVRALLCQNCNTALANVREDIAIALAVVKYLQQHKELR